MVKGMFGGFFTNKRRANGESQELSKKKDVFKKPAKIREEKTSDKKDNDIQTVEKELKLKTNQEKDSNKIAKPIIVSFYYNKKKIRNDFVFIDNIGVVLDWNKLPSIPGYHLKNNKKANYKITNVQQYVKLNYITTEKTYNLIPVTEDLKLINLKNPKYVKGKPGETISSKYYPFVRGYRPYDSRKYIFPDTGKDIQIVYTPTASIINLINETETGEVLANRVIHGKTGGSYYINPKSQVFSGYQISKMPKNLTGKFLPDNLNLTIKYEPVESKIIVSFLNKTGKAIHSPIEYQKRYRDTYTIKLPTIDGYELVSSPSLLTGYFDKITKNVVLRYKRTTVSFMINYWFDTDFKHSAGKSYRASGLVGNPYAIHVPEKEGYQSERKIIKGKFSAFENKDVNIVYKQMETVVHVILVDETDHQLTNTEQIIKMGYWGQEFKIALPEVPGYKRPFPTLKKTYFSEHQTELVHYSAKEEKIIVNFIDKKTNKPIIGYSPQEHKGLTGTTYNIEGEMIEGYQLINIPENAKGVYAADPIIVNMIYEPNPSAIVVHYFDSTLETIKKTQVLTGYFGKPYKLITDIPGYKLISATDKLAGKFPASRLDINIMYEATDVSFTLVPTDQFGKEIDSQQNITIYGKAGQEFSNEMPDIPGYICNVSEVSGRIKATYRHKHFPIPYEPKEELITVHTIIKGGNYSGMHLFQDFTQPGPMGSTLEYELPQIKGYTPDTKKLSIKYTSESQDVTVFYTVDKEKYLIQFIDEDNNLVGGMPEAEGYYKQAIDISHNVPKGFHLPEGVDCHVYLDGVHNYQVLVIADRLTVELIAQDQSGKSLGSRRQIEGNYHEVKEISALHVPGYNSTQGNKLKIKFELGQITYPITYEPQERTLTVRYIDAATGKNIKEPQIIHGKFNQEYDVSADRISGYIAINRTREHGTYGFENIEMVFLYRAISDNINQAITPLEQIIKASENGSLLPKNAQKIVKPSESTNTGIKMTDFSNVAPLLPNIGHFEQPLPKERSDGFLTVSRKV